MRETLDDRIRSRLLPQAVPTVPELRLYLAGPHSGLARLVAGVHGAGAPFWAHVWAGGLVLARYLLDHAESVAGLRVLDLGCGSGLVAIAAARAGAATVVAVDVDPCAVAATRMNAALNDMTLAVRCADPLDEAAPDVDLVLAGDVFYDVALAVRTAAYLDRCVGAGLSVLVGDPGRAPLPRGRLIAINEGITCDFGRGGATVPAAVYAFARTQQQQPISAMSRSES